jgi:hypothetical protein
MKNLVKFLALGAIALGAAACDEGSTSNPSTSARGELNPPAGLVTITGDAAVTLRWLGNNTEDGFKGYNVFVADGDFSGTIVSGTAWTASYPANANLAKGSIPRCKDNNAIFQTNFKFPESTADCEGDTAADSGATPAAGAALQDEEEAKLPFAKCDGKSDDNLSLPASEKVLGTQECKITGLTNGKTYTFVVMAVMGDEFENVSWSSNFVTDTPANNLFTSEVEITIPSGKILFLSHTDILAAVTGTDLAVTKWDSTKLCASVDVCKIGTPNTETAGGIYLGRFGGTKPARVYFSTPVKTDTDTDTIEYLYRGGQTFDPQDPTGGVSVTIPEDQANKDRANNYGSGDLTEVAGNEVIDLAIKNAANWHFGKLVLNVPSLATPADENSDLKIKISLIVQPAAGVPHYFN